MNNFQSIQAGKYRHKKTGKIYEVLWIATDKNNDIQLQVVYKDTDNVYIRELNDFSNKFSVVEEDGT